MSFELRRRINAAFPSLAAASLALAPGFSAADCSITPSTCQAAPIPSTCPPGKHWTTMGSGIAHCVLDDPVCGAGTELTHDALGNPSCFVLIVTTQSKNKSCPAGYSGTIEQERTKTQHADGSISYGSWHTVYDGCEADPPPPASPPPVDPPPALPPPVTPPPVTTPPPAPGPGGDPPVACTPVYTTSSSTDYCSGGKVGAIITNYATNSCTGAQTVTGQSGSCACPSGTSWNGSQCVSAPPPPAPSCPPPGTYCDTWGGSDGSLWDAPPMGYGKIIYSGPTCKASYVQVGTYLPINGCPN